MLRDSMVARINRRLGFRSLDAVIVDELQDAQEELENELVHEPPWFLLSEMAEATPQSVDERLPLPSDFLAEHEDGTLWRYDASATDDPWIELQKGNYDHLKREYVGTAPPRRYSIVGKYFRLHPTPDAIYVYRMLYYKRDQTLETNVENQWLRNAAWVLGARAGVKVAQDLRDEKAVQFFTTRYVESFDAMQKHHVAREEANDEATMDDMTP